MLIMEPIADKTAVFLLRRMDGVTFKGGRDFRKGVKPFHFSASRVHVKGGEGFFGKYSLFFSFSGAAG